MCKNKEGDLGMTEFALSLCERLSATETGKKLYNSLVNLNELPTSKFLIHYGILQRSRKQTFRLQ